MTGDLLAEVRRHAHDDPTHPALEAGAQRLNRGELLEHVELGAARLRARGARSLALLAANDIDWVLAALCALEAGVTLVPLPPFFTLEQQRHVLRCVRPDGVLADDLESLSRLSDAQPQHSGLGTLHLAALADGAAPPADTARITFTSGSTGTPKGVCLSARAMAAVARSLAEASDFGAEDRHLCTLPLAVLLEEIAGPWRALLSGATCVLPTTDDLGGSASSRSDGARLARTLQGSGATGAVLVPAVLEDLVRAIEAGSPAPSRLRRVGVGGAPVPVDLLRRAADVGLPVREGYGLSEAGSVVALDRDARPAPGRVGRPLPHAHVALADDGEILVGGSGLAHGWLDADGCYRPMPLRDGLFATGDLGALDDEGRLAIQGRRRNVFITGYGRNVSPEWIERGLLAHPDVHQAVVFGEGLPAPCAVVVSRTPRADLEAVRASVNHQLPDYARLAHLVPAREPFELSNGQWAATGRPLREAIAVAYADELSADVARGAPPASPGCTP